LKTELETADVELSYGAKRVKLRALVDTGASKSIVSKKIADELGAFIPLREPYELRTADEEGRLRIVGMCRVGVVFQEVNVPGGATFEVSDNLRRDIDLVIGRPEIDSWDIIFTPEGPRPRKVPIEFEII